jgi:DNA mismatch endonuclease (patch repair protein)
MTDIFSKEKRSNIMSRVRSKNTKPEIIIRKLVYSLGYRYRLYRRDLPGTPDIVFTKRKKVIFIHGCLWHGHCCKRASLPELHKDKWREKILKNIERDHLSFEALTNKGWEYMVIWQCEIKKSNIEEIKHQLTKFLENG